MTNSPPNTPNGHHQGASFSSGAAVTLNGAVIPNGGGSHHHGVENHNQEVQLQLTLGYPSSNNNEPPPPIQQLHHQNHNYHNYYHHPGASPTLQPFFFRSLSTPSVLVSSPGCYNDPHLPPHPSPPLDLPPPLVQQPALVIEAPSSSSNPPRRQQPGRQKQARASSSSTTTKDKEKSETITPLYPWASDRRCGIQPFAVLRSRGHESITGRVKCRKCERGYEIAFDLEAKFCEVASFLVTHKDELRHRAPEMWMNPSLPECVYCRQKNAVRPEIEGKKKNTNWLFLFLGQMLGCCTGEQLKYFCKHVGHHRTAAKDRLLYLAYLGMCKQLDPHGPFDL